MIFWLALIILVYIFYIGWKKGVEKRKKEEEVVEEH